VGAENFFLFGMDAAQVLERRNQPNFAGDAIDASPSLSRVLGQIAGGRFSPDEPHRYRTLIANLYEHDYFLVTGDFDDYFAKQREVDKAYQDTARWTRMAVSNTARMGWFSSDRTIRGYARDIWDVQSLK
jgi:starch phosphorylase